MLASVFDKIEIIVMTLVTPSTLTTLLILVTEATYRIKATPVIPLKHPLVTFAL
jgi:hypothetical protein